MSPTPQPANAARAKPHFYWLDWLRFLAAFSVTASHIRGGHWIDWASLEPASRTPFVAALFALTRLNLEPVVFFFVLSGFLVGGGALEASQSGVFRLRTFLIDRLTRIYLPYLPALALSGLVALACDVAAPVPVLIANVFALQGLFADSYAGNAPLWSLAYEIWFYLLAACLALILQRSQAHRVWAYAGLLLITLVFSKLSAVLLFCWLLGAAARLLREQISSTVAALVGLPLLLAGALQSQMAMDASGGRLLSLPIPTREVSIVVMSAGLGLILAALSRAAPRSPRLATFETFGGRLAAWSYTLYLVHYPFLIVVDRYFPVRQPAVDLVSLLSFGLKLVASLLFAWLFYRLFEVHTEPVRRWLRSRIVPNPTAHNG